MPRALLRCGLPRPTLSLLCIAFVALPVPLALPVRLPESPASISQRHHHSQVRSDTRIGGRAVRAGVPNVVAGHDRTLRLIAVQATRLTAPPAPTVGAGDDVQARVPGVRVGLSRVGVTGVEKVVRIREELYFARLECFVDLHGD